MSARATLLASASEAAFQAAIVERARSEGWLVYHTHDSRRSEAGFPDLVLIRGAELLALEVKTESGKVSAAQDAWLDAFGGVTVVTSALVRPSQWDAIAVRLAA